MHTVVIRLVLFVEIGICKCGLLRRGGKRSTRRKSSRSTGKNQQETQPTYGVDGGI